MKYVKLKTRTGKLLIPTTNVYLREIEGTTYLYENLDDCIHDRKGMEVTNEIDSIQKYLL